MVFAVRNEQVGPCTDGHTDGVDNGHLPEHEEPPIEDGAVGGHEDDIIDRAGNEEVSNASIYLDMENGYEASDVDTPIVVPGESGEGESSRRHRRTEAELLGGDLCNTTLRSGRR